MDIRTHPEEVIAAPNVTRATRAFALVQCATKAGAVV